MPDPDELAELERRLRALPEAAMRRELALEALESREPEAAFILLRAALRRPEAERPGVPSLRQTLHEVLVEGGAARPLRDELRLALYARAAEEGDEFVMRLLRPAASAASMRDPAAALPKPVAEIPLGVRRSLARGVDRGLLERLLLDPDPVVVEHLLENARVTEADVLRIASRRPIPATTLERIHASRRFGARPAVRRALVHNPYCPTELAVALLVTLTAPVLRDLASDASLHPEVRRHAREELGRRGST